MQKDSQHLILFDGVCNFCNSTVNTIIKLDRKDLFRFGSLQSEAAKEFIQTDGESMDSIIYLRHQQVLKKSTAALYIAQDLGFPFRIMAIFLLIPKTIRDSIYDYIAKNRYKWFGRQTQCQIPTKENRNKFI